MVYEESDTDMLIAMPLPLTDMYQDGLSPWEQCAELAARDPDRTVFWGSVNPLEGRKALDLMERQVGEFGAKAFKFYNVRYDYGAPFPWRMDDPRIAFPVFEKAQELGVNLIGVHKGVPLGPAADRAHPDLGHGRRRGQLPRPQLRHLPRRAAVPRRGVLAAHPLSEPLRLAGRDHELRRPRAPDVRRDARQAAVLVRRGQDRVRQSRRRSGTRSGRCRRSGTSRSRRTSSTATATRSSPTRRKRKILGENLLRLHGMDVEETKRRLGK